MKNLLILLIFSLFATAAQAQCPTPPDLYMPTNPSLAITCVQQTATLTAASNTPNVTWQWTGPNGFTSNQQTPMVTAAGLYVVVVTEPQNGCTATAVNSVIFDTISPIPYIVWLGIHCNQPGYLSGHVTSNTNCSWLWSNGVTSASFQTSVPGVYTVTVTNMSTGCTATSSTTLPTSTTVAYTVNYYNCGDSITVTVPNPTNTTLLWSNGSTDSTVTLTTPGPWCVTVTDPTASCIGTGCVVLTQSVPLTLPATLSTFSSPSCAGASDGWITANALGGTLPYTFVWSNGSGVNGPTITNLQSGPYSVTVTDARGCTASKTINLPAPSPMLITPTVTILTDCTVGISLSVNGGPPPFGFSWSTGQNIPTVSPLPGGVYTVTVTSASGCTATIVIDASQTCTQLLRGSLRRDVNSNCLPENTEITLENWIVKAKNQTTGTEFFARTQADGTYMMPLDLGVYTVQAVPLSVNWTNCSAQIITLTQNDTIDLDISVQTLFDCPLMEVNLSAGLMRRCFQGQYTVQYCNLGTVPATEAYIDVRLDTFLTFANSSVPGTMLSPQLFRFNVGTVAPGQCGQFSLFVDVSCNATPGQSHCTEAHIYPDTSCIVSQPGWTGAALNAQGQCASDSIRFTLKNTGTGTMSNQLEYIVIEDAIMRQSGTAPSLAPNGTMTVTVPANGSSWRIEATQDPLHPVLPNAIVNVEGCVPGNQPFSTGFVNQFSLADSQPWLDIDCTPNTGAYDPNDKAGTPVGYGTAHYIEPDTRIDYLIRFQNTGTDTAFTVRITDTLAAQFDPQTLRVLGSSHLMQTTLEGLGNLTFLFSNIMLPDSNINEAASHGFVKYSIEPRAGLPLETDVRNKAAIYFDFNAPVVTNTTQHRLGRDFVIVRLHEADDVLQAIITPNPVQDAARLVLPVGGSYAVRVSDTQGRIISLLSDRNDVIDLDVSAWKSGIYLIDVRDTSTGRRWVGKIVKL